MTVAKPPFLAGFSDPQWARFAAAGKAELHGGGEVLMRRGEPSGSVFVVVSGQLEAVDPRTSPPTILGTFDAGAVLGEMSFLDGSPVSVDVRVRGEAQCLRYPTEDLRRLLQLDGELDAAFHRGISSLLASRTRTLTSSAVTGALGRRGEARDTRELALEATTSGPARRVHMLMARGIDPHTASAIAAQRHPLVAVSVEADRVRIGSGENCEVVLPDVRIAPVHAELIRGEQGWRVVSVGSRPVVVAGSSVASAPLPDGAQFQVGRYTLTASRDQVVVHAPTDCFRLSAQGLGRDLAGHTLLEDVGFEALAGEVIALIGPSGAGKTTLLDALRGTADRGSVQMDGVDFAALLAKNPSVLGEVPQDDIVLPELTVEESLQAAARLRLASASPARRAERVNRVIDGLGLGPIRDSRIGDPERRGISGGQRKRVNIAVEVLSEDTRVLFLDEPTSGLDPRSSGDIARLARRLADTGKIVVVVTHDMSASVLAQVDHLLVLAPGGRLAWFGPVGEAAAHFDADHPAEIFERIDDRTPEQWAAHYQASDAHEMWVRRRQELAEGALERTDPPQPTALPSLLGQLVVLTQRNFKVKLRDRASVAVLVAQPLLVAAVMQLVFPRPTSGLVFLLVLSCFWFGMSASVRELIADQVVWRRESRLGLSAVAWVGSKLAVLGGGVALQCSGLTAVAMWGSGMGGMGFSAAALVGTAVLTGAVGVGTGLFVSALWSRSEAAVGTIVLLLVPQIAFSGLLMPLDHTRALAQQLALFTPVRYAFHLALCAGERLEYMRLGEWHARSISGELFLMGLRPAGEDSLGMPTSLLVAVLLGWLALSLVAATALLERKSGRLRARAS